MQVSAKRLRAVLALTLMALCIGLFASPAQAADAVQAAQRTLRQRIRHDASDRFGIVFLTSHRDRGGPARTEVTGSGRFSRRGKSAQRFSYHATVNPRNGRVLDSGYTIER